MYKAEGTWTTCFNIPNVTLPQVTYLGFTAHTGELTGNDNSFFLLSLLFIYYISNLNQTNLIIYTLYVVDNHDIVTISSRNMYASASINKGGSGSKGYKGPSSSKNGQSGGWGWFFIKFIFFIVVAVGGYIGYTAFRMNQRSSRF